MTFAQFLDQFGSAMEAFGHNKFPQVVLERIHSKVDDLTPPQMKELCNLVIDLCEHTPRTAKIAELANMVRARSRDGLHAPVVEIKLLCHFCDDLRTVRAVSTDGTHETLMLCDCTESNKSAIDSNLQRWTRQWAPLYRREKCPVEWFKPKVFMKDENGNLKFEKTAEQAMSYWAAKIKIAEQFWINQRAEVEA